MLYSGLDLQDLSSQRLLDIREKHLRRLTALYNGLLPDPPFVLAGIGSPAELDPDIEPRAWLRQALANLAKDAEKATDEQVFRPLCLEGWFYGVHFVDKLFGAEVKRVPCALGQMGGWWTTPLKQQVGKLRPPNLSEDPTFRQADALAHGMVETGVTVPFFGTQVLASPLNVAVNLHGEDFLVALVDQPEAAQRDLRVITNVILDLHRHFRCALPVMQFQPPVASGRCQPRGFGQICGCTTQLLSADVYRKFIAPLDEEILESYPHGGMIHLCGTHTQHLSTWKAMKKLRAVQLNDAAADDFEVYFRRLRDDQIIYFTPTAKVSIEQVLRISSGQRVVVASDYNPDGCMRS